MGVEEGETAPLFTLTKHNGYKFNLEKRKGKGWTILVFYYRAYSENCTWLLSTYQEKLDQLRELQAEPYAISVDAVSLQKSFHDDEGFRFTFLSDAKKEVISLYGVNIPVIGRAKRWSFILDNQLQIRKIFKDDITPDLLLPQVIDFLQNNNP